uniref:Uncharacterized protein n=1 Tax=Arundo donax TaxID=35708 RepID=A0A0A8Z6C8_ARUDO
MDNQPATRAAQSNTGYVMWIAVAAYPEQREAAYSTVVISFLLLLVIYYNTAYEADYFLSIICFLFNLYMAFLFNDASSALLC